MKCLSFLAVLFLVVSCGSKSESSQVSSADQYSQSFVTVPVSSENSAIYAHNLGFGSDVIMACFEPRSDKGIARAVQVKYTISSTEKSLLNFMILTTQYKAETQKTEPIAISAGFAARAVSLADNWALYQFDYEQIHMSLGFDPRSAGTKQLNLYFSNESPGFTCSFPR